MFNLNQAISAIVSKPEFTVRDKGDHAVIDYNISNKETFVGKDAWETNILLNLRGTAFDKATGKIIRLPFHKFFNYGEFPESDAKLDFSTKHSITQKIDGSMISPIYAESGTYLATRAGRTDQSVMSEEIAAVNPLFYVFIESCKTLGITPLFELLSPRNRIVIAYDKDELVLTGARNMYTGQYYDYGYLVELGNRFCIPVVTQYNSIANSEFKELQKKVGDAVNDEGVVIRFATGHMIKIKSAEYCAFHKALDNLKFVKDCILIHMDGKLDDCIPLLPVTRGAVVQDFILDFDHKVSQFKNLLYAEYDKVSHIELQKDFAAAVLPSEHKQFMFGLRKGTSIHDMVSEYIVKQCSRIQSCDDMLTKFGVTARY